MVSDGHRKTSAGVVPDEWRVRTIDSFSTPVRGGSPRPAGDPRYFNGDFIPWLTVASLTGVSSSQLTVVRTNSCLTEAGSRRSRILKPGTVIIANSGATLGVGKMLGLRCCANDGIAALLDFDRRVCPEFLVYFINSRTRYLREVVAPGNGQPNLNTRLIGEIEVPLPPSKAEQEAIAEALSDADALIESLEQLIQKKRHIKQGAMHELLTGKRRLPGFETKPGTKQTEVGVIPEDWVARPLLSLASVATGQVDPKEEPFCSMVLVAPNHIEEATGRLLRKATAREQGAISGKYLVSRGDVVYSKIRPHLRKAILADFNGLCSADMYPLKVKPDVSAGFIFAVILGEDFSRFAESVSVRSGMPKINREELASFDMAVPSSKAEQEAIATVLSDMDAEIDALDTQLSKARQIKQGMMHQLLTGRIRLI